MKKIAIAGGGIAGLTAALELTATPALRAQNQVTVYQMGWRLGGKLASGRVGPEKKNVEHGLHVWFGFYENAFRSLDAVYKEWNHDSRSAFQTWQDVVKPRSYTPIGYQIDSQWHLYPQLWFRNSDEPTDGKELITLFGIVTQLMSALDRIILHPDTRGPHTPLEDIPRWVDVAYHLLEGALDRFFDDEADGPLGWAAAQIMRVAEDLAEDVAGVTADHPTLALWLVKKLQAWTQEREREVEHDQDGPLMDWMLADYALTILRGLLNPVHGLLRSGDFDSVNDLEFGKWMEINGASKILLNSTFVRVIYETAFQYRGGDTTRPGVEAGTCLRTVFRMLFSYKGAMLYEVQGGMGDLVIAPIYEVLRQRGVEFRFFHKLEALHLSGDHKNVESMDFGVQAEIASSGYDALETFDYMPSWPDEPFWDQLTDGARLKADGIDFESHWCPEPYVRTETLQRGTDFDDVIVAMALGAFKPLNSDPSPCQELIDHSPEFRAMTSNLPLVPSQALQLWMDKDLAELGFNYHREHVDGALPALVDGPDPWAIWADMTQVLKLEKWPGNPPRSVHYLCGVLKSDLYKEPRANHAVPAQARAHTRALTVAWLKQYAGLYWPAASLPGSWEIDWSVLHDELGRSGEARLDAQYIRANVNPTETCVQTAVDTSRHRLAPGASGFDNVFLAGAWTRTPMNVECVEGAVMSGMLAARAICGYPRLIVGEDWLQR